MFTTISDMQALVVHFYCKDIGSRRIKSFLSANFAQPNACIFTTYI